MEFLLVGILLMAEFSWDWHCNIAFSMKIPMWELLALFHSMLVVAEATQGWWWLTIPGKDAHWVVMSRPPVSCLVPILAVKCILELVITCIVIKGLVIRGLCCEWHCHYGLVITDIVSVGLSSLASSVSALLLVALSWGLHWCIIIPYLAIIWQVKTINSYLPYWEFGTTMICLFIIWIGWWSILLWDAPKLILSKD